MGKKLTEISIKDIVAKNPVWVITAIAWMFSIWLAYYLSPFIGDLDKQDARIGIVEARLTDLEDNGTVQGKLSDKDIESMKSDIIEIKVGIVDLNEKFDRLAERQ